jgi:branched-subunit amino acid transport protein AzlD
MVGIAFQHKKIVKELEMKRFSIWTLSAIISYLCTMWIKNLFLNVILGTLLWIVIARFLDKWMEGEI